MKKIAVIGAGPAGLAAAYKLCLEGYNPDVYEAAGEVGGMCKTIDLWGYKADLGPHAFTSDEPEVTSLWLDMAGNDFSTVDRLTRIYYQNQFFSYPVKLNDVVPKTGTINAATILLSFFRQKILPRGNPESYEAWIIQNFGYKLYSMFFKSYSEKLWGIPCSEIDTDFAAQRIRRFTLAEGIKTALGLSGNNKSRTLRDRFYYPLYGTGMIYKNLTRSIIKMGGNIFLDTPLRKIRQINDDKITLEFPNSNILDYNHVISSIPLTALVRNLPGVPKNAIKALAKLKFRNTILVYLLVEHDNLFPDNWIYIHQKNLMTGRITNFRNWSPMLYGDKKGTVLSMEYWCYDHESMWKENDEQLAKRAVRELRKTGLDKGFPVSATHVERVPNCYPVFHKGYKANLKPAIDHLKTIKPLQAIGRYGAFKYNNQDHSILMGILAAYNISHNSGFNLWKVNSGDTS